MVQGITFALDAKCPVGDPRWFWKPHSKGTVAIVFLFVPTTSESRDFHFAIVTS